MAEVPALADISDLAARTGQDIDPNDAQAWWFLDTASAMVRNYAQKSWLNVDGITLTDVPEAVRRITIEAAARVWMNPDGLVQETAGPFTERRPDLFAEGFFLTATEKSQLASFRPNGLGGLWTIQQTKGDSYDPTIYVPVSPQPGERLPYYQAGTPGVQGY